MILLEVMRGARILGSNHGPNYDCNGLPVMIISLLALAKYADSPEGVDVREVGQAETSQHMNGGVRCGFFYISVIIMTLQYTYSVYNLLFIDYELLCVAES